MIDLHTHTNHSDGSDTPQQLLRLAGEAGLTTLAITDHDTFTGFEEAAVLPRPESLNLIRGIELSCRLERRSVHLLGYFLQPPKAVFLQWLEQMQASRRERNQRLANRLRELGAIVDVTEAEALGRTITGRPHFARLLVSKGYARSYEDAFRRYLGEDASAHVEWRGPTIEEGIQQVREGGGFSSLAHPVRIHNPWQEELIGRLAGLGLNALEVFHTDHSPEDSARFLRLADRFGLGVTGGSDFHGANKPGVKLGSVRFESRWLEALRP